jgi:hypothetical protein
VIILIMNYELSIMNLSYAACYCVGGGPGSLEVEAASDAIDVENLAGKVKSGARFAFQRRRVDALE